MNRIISKIPFRNAIKTFLFRPGERERAVLTGALKGLRFRFDLRSDTQQWRGVYERPLQNWLIKHVRPESTCLDIGSAQGYFTVLMAKLAGPDGVVHAFEPSGLCEQIAYHAELNGRDHVLAPVSVHKLFVVGDAVQSGPLSVTVDDVVARNASLERVDVIKIDVDGAEADVLHGASRTLERFRPHLFVEVHSRTLLNECRRILDGYGYPLRLENAASYEHRPIEYNAFLFTEDAQRRHRPESNLNLRPWHAGKRVVIALRSHEGYGGERCSGTSGR